MFCQKTFAAYFINKNNRQFPCYVLKQEEPINVIALLPIG